MMQCLNEKAASVTVAICTFKRPESLARLLGALWEQACLVSSSIEIMIVDNDPNASACGLVNGIKPPVPWKLRYFVEPAPGVSYARNRCLRESNTDFIVFIDDDEIPQPDWLVSLLETQEATDAGIVCGPVIPRFESPPPNWMRKGKFFERKRFTSGTKITFKDSRSGNVLLRRDAIALAGREFDTRYGTSGAEDTLFFKRAEESGVTIFWSDKAIVYEDIPADRMKLRWLARRAFKGGQNWVRILAESNSSVWLPMAFNGIASAFFSLILIVPSLIVSHIVAARLVIRFAGGLGKATAWFAARKIRNQVPVSHYIG